MQKQFVGIGVIVLSLIAVLSILGSASTFRPSAPDIIVNTTSDAVDFAGAQQVSDLPGLDGLVSLREAIIAANNTAGPQVIRFNIPMSDVGFDGTVFTIRPLSGLPPLSDSGTTIDGSTQATFTGDTNPAGPEVRKYTATITSLLETSVLETPLTALVYSRLTTTWCKVTALEQTSMAIRHWAMAGLECTSVAGLMARSRMAIDLEIMLSPGTGQRELQSLPG